MGKKEYYLGLDIGTSSVGIAVTDQQYKLQKYNNKYMWTSRLFDEAERANQRRSFRTARRRLKRRHQRLNILKELLAPEIAKVDPDFYLRLQESAFYPEDKKVNSRFSLFNDANFTDAEYHKKYPTIYHLREELCNSRNRYDIRLYFLAIHHILKYRGHFLYPNTEINLYNSFSNLFRTWLDAIKKFSDADTNALDEITIRTILLDKALGIKRRSDTMIQQLGVQKNSQLAYILKLLCGSKVAVKKIYDDNELDQLGTISLNENKIEENRDQYSSLLQERIELLDSTKAIFDWSLLANILSNHKTISSAMIARYNQHAADLKELKYFVLNYLGHDEYVRAFSKDNITNNYPQYLRNDADQEEVNKYFAKLLNNLSSETQNIDNDNGKRLQKILNRLELGIALPKLRVSENSTIPYQLHFKELEQILENAGIHYPSLHQKDESGYSTIEKIKSCLTFRIPYYVGPLNAAHIHENSNVWRVLRKPNDGLIRPWNFDQYVDLGASAIEFIRRMTNRCTYLPDEEVLPKSSLLYERYTVLNEINKIKINGHPLSYEFKQQIIRELFEKQSHVTLKTFKSYLKKNNFFDKELNITGIDSEFNSKLTAHNFFQKLLGDKMDEPDVRKDIERAIYLRTIFSDGGKTCRQLIKDQTKFLDENTIKSIVNYNFSGWGRLSKKLLTEIAGDNCITGEHYINILQALETTSCNLMELLSKKFTFGESIDKLQDDTVKELSYDTAFEDAYLSPAVKRSVWQALILTQEMIDIRKQLPKKIFIEVTRGKANETKKSVSRKTKLLDLYKACQEDIKSTFEKSIKNLPEEKFKQKALYLYYLQQGKDLYTGEDIDLDDIQTKSGKYNIDHIYPRSLTKDDSWDNLVLTTTKYNQSVKKNIYPLSSKIRRDRKPLWQLLKAQGFISNEKYTRLTRSTELTQDELANFISRQLVETSQATIQIANIFRKFFPETKIIFVRAKNVSELRDALDLHKNREYNNFHHAHDAFLAIVAGDIYDRIFTQNPYNFLKSLDSQNSFYTYNLDRIFTRRQVQQGRVLWDIKTQRKFVENTLRKAKVNVTRMPLERHGQLFNATIYKKNSSDAVSAPIKKGDKRLHDFTKYGSYKSLAGAYFFAVESTDNKGRRINTLEQVYLLDKAKIIDTKSLLNYCQETLKLKDPRILNPKIKFQAKIIYEGFPYYLQSRTGNSLVISPATELPMDSEIFSTYHKIQKMQSKNNLALFDITTEDLLELFDEYCRLLIEDPLYSKRRNIGEVILPERRERFQQLSLDQQISTLLEIHKLFNRNSLNGINLSSIGGGTNNCKVFINKKFQKLTIIHESATGLRKTEQAIGVQS